MSFSKEIIFPHCLCYCGIMNNDCNWGKWSLQFLWWLSGFFCDLLGESPKWCWMNFGRLATPGKVSLFHRTKCCLWHLLHHFEIVRQTLVRDWTGLVRIVPGCGLWKLTWLSFFFKWPLFVGWLRIWGGCFFPISGVVWGWIAFYTFINCCV